jgi:hypothetical protein
MSEKSKKPPQWKMAVVICIGIYPTITAVLATVGKYILQLNVPIFVKTLPITLIVVPVMVFVVLPFLHKVFGKWMTR